MRRYDVVSLILTEPHTNQISMFDEENESRKTP